ncbi:MAG: MFS transporter [bacterium]|nr:MFS transporter [bacterium]
MASSAFAGLASITAGHFLVDLCMGWLPPILPFMAEHLGMSLALAGTGVAVVTTVSSFSQPLLGWLGERVGGWGLLPACVLWTSAFTALLGLTRSFTAFVLVALLAALGSACFHPLGSVRAGRLFPAHKAKATSAFTASGSLGFALAPLVAVPLVLRVGLQSSLFLLVPGLLVAAGKLYTGRAAATGPAGPAVPRQAGGPACYRALAWLQAIMALRHWVASAFTTFLVWYLMAAGADPTRAAALLSAYLLAGVAGVVVGGILNDRFGNLAVLWWSGLVSAASFTGFLATGGGLQVVSLALAGAALHAAFPGSIVLAQELLPGSAGMAAGMMMGLTFGVGGLGVAATGWLANSLGLGAALGLTVLALGPATLLVPVLRGVGRQRRSQPEGAELAERG